MFVNSVRKRSRRWRDPAAVSFMPKWQPARELCQNGSLDFVKISKKTDCVTLAWTIQCM